MIPADLTKREWFAAIAPDAIAKWYVPVLPLRPKEPIPPAASHRLCLDWFADPCWDLEGDHPELRPFAEAARKFWSDLNDWERDCARIRAIGWRYAWADAMIEGSER